MTDKQENKLGMYYSVVAACENHNAVWSGLPAFATAFTEFQSHVDAIGDAAEAQETGVTGATKNKNTALKNLTDAAYPLGTAVQAWATVEGDTQLAERVYWSRSDYLYGRDADSETMARTVLTEATANLPALADYGVTQAKLDDLSAAIDAYHAVLVAPRAAITDRKAATAALVDHFTAADTVLKGRMDNLAPILAADTPEFGRDYENARIIVDSGGGAGSAEE